MSGRTLVLGDVHGAHRALVQVLERAAFDRDLDRLIFLGDVCDGWPETRECIDELMAIPNLVHLLGNHDAWALEWIRGEHPGDGWTEQGGRATIASYGHSPATIPSKHREYLETAKLWHLEGGRLFVHGGYWLTMQHPANCGEMVTWDRELWRTAYLLEALGKPQRLTRFLEVFVGHTTTTRIGFDTPAHCCEVWNLDQGAGYEGRLSLMDVESKEFWQSDPVGELYPGIAGRRG